MQSRSCLNRRPLLLALSLLLLAPAAARAGAAAPKATPKPSPKTSPKAVPTQKPADAREAFEQKLAQLEQGLALVASRRQKATCAAAVALLAQIDYLRWRLGRSSARTVPADLNREAQRIAQDATVIRSGKNPFADRTGNLLRGYLALVDGRPQPYSITLPAETFKDPQKRWPLVIDLHVHGWSDWFRPFQGHPAAALPEAIVVAPHGRGSVDFMELGEDDVLAVLDEVLAEYPVDPDRVYLTGYSMGATGCWNLAVRHPDLFAAVAPVAGLGDFRAWDEAEWTRRGLAGTPFRGLRDRLRANTCAETFAENLRDLPVRARQGGLDEPVPEGAGVRLVDRLAELGYENVEVQVEPETGFHAVSADLAADFARLAQFRRERFPRQVTWKTDRLRYAGAYWVRIEEIPNLQEYARVEAEYRPGAETNDGQGELALSLENVSNLLLLDLDQLVAAAGGATTPPARVVVNGQTLDLTKAAARPPLRPAATGRPAPAGAAGAIRSARVYQVGLQWQVDVCRTSGAGPAPARATVRKLAGLEGPVADAFRSPFIIVYGTQSKDVLEQRIIREEAERLARQWERRYGARPRLKADTAVTEREVQELNLILFGHQEANLLTRLLVERLPALVLPAKPGSVPPDAPPAPPVPARPTPPPADPSASPAPHQHAEDERPVAVRLGQSELWEGSDLGLILVCPNPVAPSHYVVLFAATAWRGMYQISTRFGNWFDWTANDNRLWFDFAVFDDRSRLDPETLLAGGAFDEKWRLAARGRFRGDPAFRERSAPRVLPRYASPPAGARTLFLSELFPRTIDTVKGGVSFDQSFEGRPLGIGEENRYERGLGLRVMSSLEWDLEARAQRFRAEVGVDLEGQKLEELPAERRRAERVSFVVYGDGRELWRKAGVKAGDAPVQIDLALSGVRVLRLAAENDSPEAWLYGSLAWGAARVELK